MALVLIVVAGDLQAVRLQPGLLPGRAPGHSGLGARSGQRGRSGADPAILRDHVPAALAGHLLPVHAQHDLLVLRDLRPRPRGDAGAARATRRRSWCSGRERRLRRSPARVLGRAVGDPDAPGDRADRGAVPLRGEEGHRTDGVHQSGRLRRRRRHRRADGPTAGCPAARQERRDRARDPRRLGGRAGVSALLRVRHQHPDARRGDEPAAEARALDAHAAELRRRVDAREDGTASSSTARSSRSRSRSARSGSRSCPRSRSSTSTFAASSSSSG